MAGCRRTILQTFSSKEPYLSFQIFSTSLAMSYVHNFCAREYGYISNQIKLFFPSLFAGPSFDFVDYRRWIETTMFEIPAGTDPSAAPKTHKKRKIPSSSTPATIKAVIGLVWILLFLKFAGWYNSNLVLGDQYMKYGFLRRVWILEMLGFSTRMKYYGVWYLTEGACILSGLGYNGVNPKTNKVDWNRLQNVNPWGIESAQNSRAYLENWNMNTNHWLRNYMYLRVTPKGKKPGFRASLATFVTSAFWHGFYPGYYLTFILAAFLQTIAKSKFRSQRHAHSIHGYHLFLKFHASGRHGYLLDLSFHQP